MALLVFFGQKFTIPIFYKILARKCSSSIIDKKDPSCDITQCRGSVKYLLPALFKPMKHLPPALYGGKHFVTVVPGNGIGPEMMEYVKDVLEFMSVPIYFEEFRYQKSNDMEEIIDSIMRNQLCIKGHMETYSDQKPLVYRNSPNVAIRKRLNLFVNFVHFVSYKNVGAKFEDLDIAVVRQNTEGEYAMIECEPKKGIVNCSKVVTEENSRKIAEWAFQFAQTHKRKKVTIIHKADKKDSDGLFLSTCLKISKGYPEIEVNDMAIDRIAKYLVTDPYQFDILLCSNLYGCVVTNIINGLVRGLGTTGSILLNDTHAVFESPSRSRATALINKGIANPTALLNSAANLLSHIGQQQKAQILRNSIRRTIEKDNITTPDLGGGNSTDEFVRALKLNLKNGIEMAEKCKCNED